MASSAPNSCISLYHDTHTTTNGSHNVLPMPEEYFFASIPPHQGYTMSQDDTIFSTPAWSIGMQSGGPVSSTDLAANNNGGFSISESYYAMRSSDNRPILMDQTSCGFGVCSSTPSLPLRNGSHSTFSLHSHLVPPQNIQLDTVGFFDSTSIPNHDVQGPVGELFAFGNSGWYRSQQSSVSKRLNIGSTV